MPGLPGALNIKPARFGSLHALFAAYDFCATTGTLPYGGGMFELGPGRGQLQYLASLFHPDSPNDLAPPEYNLATLQGALPASPLTPRPHPTGFRWGPITLRRSIRDADQQELLTRSPILGGAAALSGRGIGPLRNRRPRAGLRSS